jgi:hypothetical protein
MIEDAKSNLTVRLHCLDCFFGDLGRKRITIADDHEQQRNRFEYCYSKVKREKIIFYRGSYRSYELSLQTAAGLP